MLEEGELTGKGKVPMKGKVSVEGGKDAREEEGFGGGEVLREVKVPLEVKMPEEGKVTGKGKVPGKGKVSVEGQKMPGKG